MTEDTKQRWVYKTSKGYIPDALADAAHGAADRAEEGELAEWHTAICHEAFANNMENAPWLATATEDEIISWLKSRGYEEEKLLHCGHPQCFAVCVCAHPYQVSEPFYRDGVYVYHDVLEEGEDLEMRCEKCGAISWERGNVRCYPRSEEVKNNA